MTELSFPAALALLAAGLVGGIWAAGAFGIWSLVPATVGVVALLAGLYLVSYSRRPHAAQPAPLPAEEEPFVDPVEEADRIGTDEKGGSEEPSPIVAIPPVAPGPPSLATTAGGNDPK